MKKKISINKVLTIIGIAFLAFALLPIIKAAFSIKKNVSYGKKEEWVEVPFITE